MCSSKMINVLQLAARANDSLPWSDDRKRWHLGIISHRAFLSLSAAGTLQISIYHAATDVDKRLISTAEMSAHPYFSIANAFYK